MAMDKDILIKQHDRQDCGAACIASIASYYGLKLPLIKIREACGTSKDGTSIKGITDAAKVIGMSAKAFKSENKECENLIQIPKPLILHLQNEDGWLHFVVLYDIDKKNAFILDTSDGKIHKMPISTLRAQWSGYLVLLTPSPQFNKGDSRTNVLKKFTTLLMANKRELLPALLGALVYIIIGLSTSLFIQQIIDKVLPEKNTTMLAFYGIIMLLLIGMSLFINYFRTIFTVRGGIRIDSTLIMNYISHLFRLPVSFFSGRTSGELNSRIGDAYRIRSFLSGRLMIIFISIISLLLSFALLFTFYWKLAIITVMFVPLYILLYKISDKINKKTNKKIIEASAKMEETNIDSLSAIEGIRYFCAEETFSRRMEKHYVDMAQKLYQGGKNLSIFSTCSDGITKMLTFSVLILGSLFVINSELTIGELVFFYSIAAFFSSPLMALVDSNNQITEAQIAAQRLFEIMELDSEEREESLKYIPAEWNEITIDKVTFSYPGRLDLLKELSFTIQRGTITAVTGDNGCGKSTLASLLMRGYEPVAGSIRIGEINISQINTSYWRKFISIVPQRSSLFNGTILENIAPDEENINIEKASELCTLCGLDTLIRSLKGGLLTRIGENGKYLSQGERHKLALARAMYRKPQVLILDEVTASLDKESREKILTLIKRLAYEGMTILMISHQDESIQIADNIYDIKTIAQSRVEDRAPCTLRS